MNSKTVVYFALALKCQSPILESLYYTSPILRSRPQTPEEWERFKLMFRGCLSPCTVSQWIPRRISFRLSTGESIILSDTTHTITLLDSTWNVDQLSAEFDSNVQFNTFPEFVNALLNRINQLQPLNVHIFPL